MEQVFNTVLIPREEYDSLVQQRDELLAALKLWKLASDNAEESELDDMACYCGRGCGRMAGRSSAPHG